MMKQKFEEFLQKAASYCSVSEHCISEVEAKLATWGATEKETKAIVSQLQKDEFIDERRFCKAFVKDRFRFNHWGKSKIAFALVSKGIERSTVDEALMLIDEGEYEEMLASLLKKKLEGITYRYEYEKQGKLFRFAQSKGFEAPVIERVLRLI